MNILLIVSNILTVVSIIVSLAQIALALRIFQTATKGGRNRLLSCLFSCLRAGQNLDICNVRVRWGADGLVSGAINQKPDKEFVAGIG